VGKFAASIERLKKILQPICPLVPCNL